MPLPGTSASPPAMATLGAENTVASTGPSASTLPAG